MTTFNSESLSYQLEREQSLQEFKSKVRSWNSCTQDLTLEKAKEMCLIEKRT